MKGDPADHPLPARCAVAGTPAGNSPYTQEQHEKLRAWGYALDEVWSLPILVEFVPNSGVDIPSIDPDHPPPSIHEAQCPVLDAWAWLATIIAPNGRLMQVEIPKRRG
jgi:hypothetical protein